MDPPIPTLEKFADAHKIVVKHKIKGCTLDISVLVCQVFRGQDHNVHMTIVHDSSDSDVVLFTLPGKTESDEELLKRLKAENGSVPGCIVFTALAEEETRVWYRLFVAAHGTLPSSAYQPFPAPVNERHKWSYDRIDYVQELPPVFLDDEKLARNAGYFFIEEGTQLTHKDVIARVFAHHPQWYALSNEHPSMDPKKMIFCLPLTPNIKSWLDRYYQLPSATGVQWRPLEVDDVIWARASLGMQPWHIYKMARVSHGMAAFNTASNGLRQWAERQGLPIPHDRAPPSPTKRLRLEGEEEEESSEPPASPTRANRSERLLAGTSEPGPSRGTLDLVSGINTEEASSLGEALRRISVTLALNEEVEVPDRTKFAASHPTLLESGVDSSLTLFLHHNLKFLARLEFFRDELDGIKFGILAVGVRRATGESSVQDAQHEAAQDVRRFIALACPNLESLHLTRQDRPASLLLFSTFEALQSAQKAAVDYIERRIVSAEELEDFLQRRRRPPHNLFPSASTSTGPLASHSGSASNVSSTRPALVHHRDNQENPPSSTTLLSEALVPPVEAYPGTSNDEVWKVVEDVKGKLKSLLSTHVTRDLDPGPSRRGRSLEDAEEEAIQFIREVNDLRDTLMLILSFHIL
ncbi:hypothetical protein FRB90_001621 [Tulasnella sp. 427]|nr:hypothetical protein FRB90_001621 [Tulasnella sp. 427]